MKTKSLLVLFVLSVLFVLLPRPIFAANLTNAMIRPGRMTASFLATTSDPVLVVFTPAGVGGTNVEANLRITWDSNYTIPTGTVNVTTTGIPATIQGTALNALVGIGSTAASNNGTHIIDVNTSNLTKGTMYGFFITSGVQNPAGTSTSYVSTLTTQVTTGGATVDTSRVATYNLAGSDQVAITAEVPPTFTMVLSANALTFPDLTTTAQNTTATMTITLTTNARNGWATWIRSLNGGLLSGSNLIGTDNNNPNTCQAKEANLSLYQFDVISGTHGTYGTGTAPTTLTKFSTCGAGTGGSMPANTWQEFSRNNGTTSGDILTIQGIAAIAGYEPAATDYADTWTIIGAANF